MNEPDKSRSEGLLRQSGSVVPRAWPLLAPCLILLIAWLLVSVGGSIVVDRELTLALVYVILVVGFYSFAGLSGILSFGHMSFMAVGAYVTGLVTMPVALKAALLPELPGFLADAELAPVIATIAAGLCAALFAGILSIPIMRVAGIAAALSMFAVLLIVHDVTSHWDAVTRGRQGLAGVPTNTTSFSALVVAMLAVAGVYAFQESRIGLLLRAARDQEVVARASGVDVVAARRIAFVLSGFVIGVGGALYAQFVGAFGPDSFYLSLTFLTIAMLVVGGQHSLAGAVVGTAVYAFSSAVLLRFEEGAHLGPIWVNTAPGLREVGLALILILVLAFRPEGIMQGREFRWGSWRSIRSERAQGDAR